MPTMSHTPEQRKLWHAGKVKGGADTRARRVADALKRGKNKGAHTPTFMKRGAYYAGIQVAKGYTARMAYLAHIAPYQ